MLIILWAIARLPSIISGDRFPLNVMDVSIVFFQIVYVGTATIIVAEREGSRLSRKIVRGEEQNKPLINQVIARNQLMVV